MRGASAATEHLLALLDCTIRVRTDVEVVDRLTLSLFGRFVADAGLSARASLEIMSCDHGGWTVRDESLDAVIDRPEWLGGILKARVLDLAGNHAESADLLHGAALSRSGRAVAILGDSGFGKSTLTLALLARGFGFLSDEVAALDRDSGRVAPFPKAIEARAESLRLAGIFPPDSVPADGKHVLDPESLLPGCLSDSAPLAEVIVLDDESGSPAPVGDGWESAYILGWTVFPIG